MIWSQLRKQIRSLICDELRERVDFHRAVYRKSHDGMYDHAYITVDGEKVFELSHGAWTRVWRAAVAMAKEQFPEDGWRERNERVSTAIKEAGVESSAFLGNSLHRYLEIPIQEARESENPLLRALAMIDRRTGQRALEKIALSPEEDPLVRTFFELRRSAV